MSRSRSAPARAVGAFRGGLVMLMLLAWFAISNHCALAALSAGPTPSGAACCEKKAPAKPAAPMMACCKVLPAIDASVAAFTPQTFATGEMFYAQAALDFAPKARARFADYLPTGPPAASSVSEFVRCHRSHAPPLVG